VTDSKVKLARNLNSVIAANVACGMANLFALGWFARVLGPGTMGDYAVVSTGVQLIAAFLSAGFDQAVIRMPSDRSLVAAAALATFGQSLSLVASSVAVYSIAAAVYPEASTTLLGPAAIVVAAVVISMFANLHAAPLAARMDYGFLALARVAALAIGLGCGLAIAFSDQSAYALAFRDAVSAVVMLALCRARLGESLPWRTNGEALKRLFDFGKSLWALNVTERLVLRLDYGIVGVLLGREAVGAYFVVRGLIEGVLGFLVQPVQTVLYAYYCRVNDGGYRNPLDSANVTGLYVLVCLGFAAVSWIAGPSVARAVVGAAYVGASSVLPALVVYSGAILWFENQKVFAIARGVHRHFVGPRLVQLAMAAALIAPAVKVWGMVGASVATALGAVVLAIMATAFSGIETKR